MSEAEAKQTDIAALTVELLSAYLANNSVPSEELAGLIRSTRSALTDELAPIDVEAAAPTITPAVSARKSIASPEHILSLIDGKPYQTLKRHLARHGLTPETYRERYNLPSTYPMVAPAFAAKRRAIAQKIGLGRQKNEGGPVEDSHAPAAADVPGAGVDNMAADAPVQRAMQPLPAPDQSKASASAEATKVVSTSAAGPGVKRSRKRGEAVDIGAKPKEARAQDGTSSEPKAERSPKSAPNAKAGKAKRAKKMPVPASALPPKSEKSAKSPAEDTANGEATPAGKAGTRRTKLSLFVEGAKEQAPAATPAPSANDGALGEKRTRTSARQPKSRRMARPATPSAGAAKVDDKE